MKEVKVMSELTVASWNILLDEAYPQEDRIEDIINTLKEVNRTHVLGALGIMEAQDTPLGHGGRMIAQALYGSDGDWQLHSRKKRKEYIGMAGPEVNEVEFIDLGHSKYAALTRVDDITIATVHLRKKRGHEQNEQTEALLERLADEQRVVMMGDFNGERLQRPRRMIHRQGYNSAFSEIGMRRRRTVPTKEFMSMPSRVERLGMFVIRGGVNVDDIYVKGLEVKDAGYFEGRSDHLGMWTTVESTGV